MIKITVEITNTGEKSMIECDAFAMAVVENMGSVNEKIYTAVGNVGNGDVDVEELTDAITERVFDDNFSAFAEAMGLDVDDILDLCQCNDEDCVECGCCPCCSRQ